MTDNDSSSSSSEDDVDIKLSKKNLKPKNNEIKYIDKKVESQPNQWNIGKRKKLSIQEFKGKKLIHIREYYNDGAIEKPGKKGIALNVDEFLELSDHIAEIKQYLKQEAIKKFNQFFLKKSYLKI